MTILKRERQNRNAGRPFPGASLFLLALCGAWLGLGSVERAQADPSVGHVYLTGQVHQEGAVEIPANGKLTVVQAIITNGGLGEFADSHRIKILRKKSDGTAQVIMVDWDGIFGGHLEKDVTVLPDDIIVVQKRLVNF